MPRVDLEGFASFVLALLALIIAVGLVYGWFVLYVAIISAL